MSIPAAPKPAWRKPKIADVPLSDKFDLVVRRFDPGAGVEGLLAIALSSGDGAVTALVADDVSVILMTPDTFRSLVRPRP
jgi:hypothetical protein